MNGGAKEKKDRGQLQPHVRPRDGRAGVLEHAMVSMVGHHNILADLLFGIQKVCLAQLRIYRTHPTTARIS